MRGASARAARPGVGIFPDGSAVAGRLERWLGGRSLVVASPIVAFAACRLGLGACRGGDAFKRGLGDLGRARAGPTTPRPARCAARPAWAGAASATWSRCA